MILKEFAWEEDVKNHCAFVYDPEDEKAVCDLHTADSTQESSEEPTDNTEPTEETEPPEETQPPTEEPEPPTEPEPELFLPPQEEEDWYRRKIIA